MPGVALVVALSFAAPLAQAEERARVVLLKARGGSRFSIEILSRLRGELLASNVDLEVIAAPDDVAAKEAVQTDFPELEPDVVLLVLERREANRRTEEIWLSDRKASRLFVQRVNADPAEPARSARWVAVQAAELVRARMADSLFSRRAPPPVPAPAFSPPLVAVRAPAAARISTGFGIGLLHGFHSLSDTWIPMARLSVSLFDSAASRAPLALEARVSAGVGIGRGLVYGEQSANVRQSFGMLDMLLRFAPRSPVQPLLSIGGGSYVLDVDGSASAPYENHSQRTWSGLNSLGAGLGFTPFAGASFVLDATLLDVWSKTTVRFGSEDIVRVGAPIALFGATASAVF